MKKKILELAREHFPREGWDRATGPAALGEPPEVRRARNFLRRRASIEAQATLVYEAILASASVGEKVEAEVAFFVPVSDSRIWGPPQECQGREFTLKLRFEVIELEQRAAIQEGGGSGHPFQLANDVHTPAVPTPIRVRDFVWTGKRVRQVVLRAVEVLEHNLPDGWEVKVEDREVRLYQGRTFYELGELPYKVGEEAVVTERG